MKQHSPTSHVARSTYHIARSTQHAARIALLALSLCALLLSGCTMTTMYLAVVQEEATGPAEEIHGPLTIGQTFTVSRNNLARIDLPIYTYNRANHHPLIFHLAAVSGQPSAVSRQLSAFSQQPVAISRQLSAFSYQPDDLVTIELRPEAINPNGYTRITFSPIPDSAGKTYYFYLDSPDSIPGDAMTIFYHVADVYKGGQGYINGQPIAGDLAFRAYTREVFTPRDVWNDFIGRAAGDVPFFVCYGLLLVAVLAALVAATLRNVR